nr:MAG TPA: hypothetical protein [Caudoviricetes sp.]
MPRRTRQKKHFRNLPCGSFCHARRSNGCALCQFIFCS